MLHSVRTLYIIKYFNISNDSLEDIKMLFLYKHKSLVLIYSSYLCCFF